MFQPSMGSFDTSARAMMDASLLATALIIASYRDPNPALYREHYGRSHRLAALPAPVRRSLPANVLARLDALNDDQRHGLADLAEAAIHRLAA